MATTRGPDAVKLLTDQHKAVKRLFKQYEKMKESAGDEDKQTLANRICKELTMHAQIEEEIFYPACKESIEEEDLVDEAQVEHASAKDLIAQIQSMSPTDELYDAKVKVLGEYVDHHVEEEETEMFPQAKQALDTRDLGRQLDERTMALRAELGITDPPPEPPGGLAVKKAPSKKVAAKKAIAKKAVAKKGR